MTAHRVLVVAEGVTLAHVGRSLRLATILHEHGDDVVLACDPRYQRFLAGLPFEVRPIASISSADFLDALARGRPVYSSATLMRYVADDIALLESVRPDAVAGDFRISLSVSARVAGVPYINVTNAYWSPYARPEFRLPSLSFARYVNVAMAESIFRIVRPLAFALHAMPMNAVRRAHGLAASRLDVREIYCDGDMTLYADFPALIPLFDAPSSHRYIGPVLWSPPVELPPWWSQVLEGDPPIYVSLGSSGAANLLPAVVETLRSLRRPLVVATAGRSTDLETGDRVWVADFVPGEAIAAIASAVICNGGSPTAQQALVHGVPLVGIASNLDQYLNMGYVERFGAGRLVRADRADPVTLREAALQVIESSDIRAQARRAAALAAGTRVELEFPRAIEALLATARRTGARPQ